MNAMATANLHSSQKHFNLDESKDDDLQLISTLNFFEKGNDCIVIHPGSHSIKFGLASQQTPFIVPSVIAHPRRKTCDLKQAVADL